MFSSRQDINLMAPAGNFDSLTAAIQGGADSVYFGIGRMNMRSRSSFNFGEKDIEKIVRLCRHFNKKAYMTLNVIIYNNELEEARRLIDIAVEKGIDAIIASDMAAIEYARQAGMEVHASTQLNVSNTEALKFYSKYAEVVVLARELNLEAVSEIATQVERMQIKGPKGAPVAIEIFAHGALCMAVSGKCYLSLHNHNYSANRGECLQDCRRGYIVTEKESGTELEIDNPYIMSPKDLCTIGFIDRILEAGVSVLKIEGRARSPEYVKIVTGCYDQAIKSYFEGNYDKNLIQELEYRLSTVYNRGFWEGYYLGRTMGEWNDRYGSKAIKKKVYIAKSMNYFSRLGVAEFLCESGSLKAGDKILIIGPTTGVVEQTSGTLMVDDKVTDQVNKGDRFSIPVTNKIRRADRLYKLVDA
jgi:U32 family peptidase